MKKSQKETIVSFDESSERVKQHCLYMIVSNILMDATTVFFLT